MPARANRPGPQGPPGTDGQDGEPGPPGPAGPDHLPQALGLHALNERLEAALRRSAAEHRRAYEDTGWFVYTTQWADTTGWTAISPGLNVAGNRAYGDADGAFVTRPLAAGTTAPFRLVTRFKWVPGGSGITLAAGVTSGDGGTAFSGATVLFVGDGGTVYAFHDSAPQGSIGTLPGAGDYVLTIVGDEAGVSFDLAATDRSWAASFRRTRAQVGAIANATLIITDSRGAAGNGVGPLGWRLGSIATIAPRTNIEGVGYTAIRTTAAGDGIRIELPPGYDSRVPAPLFLGGHGYVGSATGGELESAPTGGLGAAQAMFKAVLDKGFVLATSNTGGDTLGNQAAQDALEATLRWCLDHLAISGVVLYGISGGGIAAFNALVRRRTPAAGFVSMESGPDLIALAERMRDNPGSWDPGVIAATRAAYGISADWANLYTALDGWSAASEPVAAFRGIPLLLTYSPDDSPEGFAENEALLAALEGWNEATLHEGSGPHNDPSLFPAALIADFAEACVR